VRYPRDSSGKSPGRCALQFRQAERQNCSLAIKVPKNLLQVYANIPLPLASALDLEAGETVTWKVVDRAHLLLVRLPERKPLTGVSRPVGWKTTRRGQEPRS
jgi:hypothetical protein